VVLYCFGIPLFRMDPPLQDNGSPLARPALPTGQTQQFLAKGTPAGPGTFPMELSRLTVTDLQTIIDPLSTIPFFDKGKPRVIWRRKAMDPSALFCSMEGQPGCKR
jgi:hypothetical protein